MKSIHILALIVLSFPGTSASKKDAKNFYYFCISRSREVNQLMGKQYIYITDAKEIAGEQKDIELKTADWGKIVESTCKNPRGCTSDLNCYFTPEQAKSQLERAKKRYSDTSRYIIQKIDF